MEAEKPAIEPREVGVEVSPSGDVGAGRTYLEGWVFRIPGESG